MVINRRYCNLSKMSVLAFTKHSLGECTVDAPYNLTSCISSTWPSCLHRYTRWKIVARTRMAALPWNNELQRCSIISGSSKEKKIGAPENSYSDACPSLLFQFNSTGQRRTTQLSPGTSTLETLSTWMSFDSSVRMGFSLKNYDVIGFDLDHTLARYRMSALYRLCYTSILEHLIELGYPRDIFK